MKLFNLIYVLKNKILELFNITYVIEYDSFETQRIVKRGKKLILQKLTYETYAGGGDWYDYKIIN